VSYYSLLPPYRKQVSIDRIISLPAGIAQKDRALPASAIKSFGQDTFSPEALASLAHLRIPAYWLFGLSIRYDKSPPSKAKCAKLAESEKEEKIELRCPRAAVLSGSDALQ
jgi:hypothetical protein